MANYVAELGQSSEAERGQACFTDTMEQRGGLGDLGDIVCWSDDVDHCIAYLNKVSKVIGQSREGRLLCITI